MAPNDSLLDSIIARLQSSRGVVITGHVNPDGDSLGSSLALRQFLSARGVRAEVVSANAVPERFTFLPGADLVRSEQEMCWENFDLMVVLDCGDLERTGLSIVASLDIINIDHHASNRGDLGLAFVDTQFASVGQQVKLLAQRAAWDITPDVATCLYTALATDTGFFRHSNTTPTVLRDAASLLEAGAALRMIVERCLEHKSLAELSLLRHALGTLRQYGDGRISVLEITYEVFASCGVDESVMEGLVDYPRSVPGTKIAVLLRGVQRDATKVSLRSRGDVDVAAVAIRFGGGGHKNAAGCTIFRSLPDCREDVIAELRRVLLGE